MQNTNLCFYNLVKYSQKLTKIIEKSKPDLITILIPKEGKDAGDIKCYDNKKFKLGSIKTNCTIFFNVERFLVFLSLLVNSVNIAMVCCI